MKIGFYALFLMLTAPLTMFTGNVDAGAMPSIPSDVNAARAHVLDIAHKTWRKDAMVTQIALQWSPNGTGIKPHKFWLLFTLLSPSNRHTAFVTTDGGEQDDAIQEDRMVEPEILANLKPIPEFKIELPAAITHLRKGGLTAELSDIKLGVWEANNTPPVLAWVMHLEGQDRFPVVVDAQTGEELFWKRVMDPPPTDKQIAEAWNSFIHRNDPPRAAGGGGEGCFSGVEVMYGMCMDSGGGFVDPNTGTH